MKIGIFGGTFDPVHLGHMIIAREALERLGLSELWFVPAGNPWLKDEWKISPPGYRLKMLELSIRGSPAFKISHVDLKRPGLSYTVDTLKDIKGETGAGDSLYFIMGIDSLKSFPTWKEPGTVISLCTLVSVPRPGSGKTLRVEILEKKVP
ncbi:MAG: nicotinate-nucleotide adenylyltransferase, partial [Dehalococcoidia bacterium]|nr:nicotinate-nucleotide adenylyltransferase [Dehalococcoidia bacterium]